MTSLILANIAGWIVAHWKWLVGAILGLFLLIVIWSLSARVYRWFNPPAKLDEVQIQKAERAIEQNNREQLKEVLAESDTAIENADSSIKQAEQNTANAQRSYDDWSIDELKAEIERRKHEQQ